ncbi:MAG: aromatic ring-hydroxylating dioxygenase subunit alpha [Sphingorhabdus sp.]
MATVEMPGSKVGQWVRDDQQAGTFKVNREAFTSPEVLALEKERIFDRSWLYLGHGSELKNPNDFLTRYVGGRELIFNRSRKGEYQAFLNVCPHRGAQVVREPTGNAISFKCFYHGWAFNNNGKFATKSRPGTYPDDFDCNGAVDLARVPRLESYRDFFFISYDADIGPLAEYLAGAAEILDLVADHSPNGMEIVGGTQEYSIKANWKLLVENSNDGFHASETHETYFGYLMDELGGPDAVDLKSLDQINRARDLGNGHAVVETKAPWGRPIARPLQTWGEQAKTDAESMIAELNERVGPERALLISDRDRNMGVFPNLVMNDIMAITVRTFYPDAPDRMTVRSWALAPVGEEPEARHRRLNNFLEFLGPGGFATPDDVEALESAQRGYGAVKFAPWNDISRGMHRDPPRGDDEAQMRAFWREWNRRMEAE